MLSQLPPPVSSKTLPCLKLFVRLEELLRVMRLTDLFEELIVDGSFVTSKEQPNLSCPYKLRHVLSRTYSRSAARSASDAPGIRS